LDELAVDGAQMNIELMPQAYYDPTEN